MSSEEFGYTSSGEELEDPCITEDLAYSLFDDYKSHNASDVYKHMKEEYGFDYKLLGNGMLHRVALINYLERAKRRGDDVLDCYKKIATEPNIILDNFEESIKPPFLNDKLIWDFMEDDSGKDDDIILSRHISRGCSPEVIEYTPKYTEKNDFKTSNECAYLLSYSNLDIHREMVLDEIRTGAYSSFISLNNELFKDKVILDVGCGCGVLSLLAAKAGAKLVVGLDISEKMVRISQEHAEINNINNALFFVGMVEDSDLVFHGGDVHFNGDLLRGESEPFFCDVIISEWMGYALFFEDMLRSVLYARDKYLKKDGLMVPSAVKLGCFALDLCDEIKLKLTEWDIPKYGLKLSCLKHDCLELLSTPVVETVKPGTIVSSANAICVIDLYKVKSEALTNFSQEFKVEINENSKCSSLALYFDCIFEPVRSVDASCDGITNLSNLVLEDLSSYKDKVPTLNKYNIFSMSPDYEKRERNGQESTDGLVTVVMSTRPDQPATHWKQTILHLMGQGDNPVEMRGGGFRGKITFLPHHQNHRWLNIVLSVESTHGNETVLREHSYYKLK